MCEACGEHALTETFGGIVIAFGFVFTISALLLATAFASVVFIVIFSLLTLGLVGLARLRLSDRRARALGGHHAIAMIVTPGKTVVSTSNRRLVDDIIELNRRSVHYVN